ncbi:hypothetical protein DL771_002416 [Monosporascus sp. 5C6A]|nr:hypothetical protein DL771_002416 [Monosporascus sp. 5C6A]
MSLAPPVTRDGFSFAGGDLFVEASGHNRHRRATPAELRALFFEKPGSPDSSRDHPAHWFEAQLLHYGLPPSKTKAVARMRFFDALKADGKNSKLVVPSHIQQLEAELRKEWAKRERSAKKALKDSSTAAVSTAKKSTNTKRKAAEISSLTSVVDLTVSVGGVDIKVSTSSSNSSKKTKTTTSKSAASTAAAATTKATKATTPKPKATTTKGTTTPKATPASAAKQQKPRASASTSASKPKTALASSRAPSSSSSRTTTASATPAKKQTARRGGGVSQGPPRGTSTSGGTSSGTGKPRTKQTARRGGGTFVSRERIPGPAPGYDGDFDYDGPPPPYSEYPDDDDHGYGYDDGYGGSYYY